MKRVKDVFTGTKCDVLDRVTGRYIDNEVFPLSDMDIERALGDIDRVLFMYKRDIDTLKELKDGLKNTNKEVKNERKNNA